MNKRVLIVIESLSQGGAETSSVNLANGLIKRGCIVGFAAAEGPIHSRIVSGITFFELPGFYYLNIMKILSALRRTLEKFEPDVIHSHNATHCFIIRLLFLFSKHPMLVLTYHSIKTKRIPDLFLGLIFNLIADKIITVADHRRKSLLHAGVERNKLFLIPNFIDIKEWSVQRNCFDKKSLRDEAGLRQFNSVMLISARLIPSKNVDFFIRIVDAIHKTGQNIAGVILGDGPERLNLENLVKQLHLEDRVFFLGFRENVIPYYLGSDIFVFPTAHQEVLPMALIEASAAGLPIVCSDIPGNNEIVSNDVNGFLVQREEREYTEKILTLLNNPEVYSKFSKNTLKSVARMFDSETCIARILKTYG